MFHVLGQTAVNQIRRLIREEQSKYRNPEALRARWHRRDGGAGSASDRNSPCDCGGCLSAGAISACAAIGDAPTDFKLILRDDTLIAAFGVEVVLTHDSSCTWVSDLFENVDLGGGDHDYTWTLVFTGTSIEEATLTLSDET